MTAEELELGEWVAKQIRVWKQFTREITVSQAIDFNKTYDRYGITPLVVDSLDDEQEWLSEIILGGDTDQVVSVDRSTDCG